MSIYYTLIVESTENATWLTVKQKFCASSWLIIAINLYVKFHFVPRSKHALSPLWRTFKWCVPWRSTWVFTTMFSAFEESYGFFIQISEPYKWLSEFETRRKQTRCCCNGSGWKNCVWMAIFFDAVFPHGGMLWHNQCTQFIAPTKCTILNVYEY